MDVGTSMAQGELPGVIVLAHHGADDLLVMGFGAQGQLAAHGAEQAVPAKVRMYAAGFGQQPRFGFPGAVAGRVRPYKSWRPIEQATMSYGHGISVSLIQLARAYTIFARDGDLIPLSFLKLDQAPVGQRIISQKTARDLRAMLETVVSPEGTAPKAQVPGYRVGGKTGTAYKIVGGKYVRNYVASFVGFAPASDPRIIVAVMVDEPTGGHYGGEVAAPVFAAVTASALRAMNVAPDSSVTDIIIPADAVQESM